MLIKPNINEEINIHLAFLEPYRLIEWHGKNERKTNARYLRGQSFARWHKGLNCNGGKPYITGTLLRSAVIWAAEELLSLNNWEWNNIPCCGGKFHTPGQIPLFLRKRATLQPTCNNTLHADSIQGEDAERCIYQDKDGACPLCIILGRFDTAQKDHKGKNFQTSDYAIHFGNLNLKNENPSLKLKDIAGERILNRVDYSTGKAQDYFRVWEVDNEDYWEFTGTITVNEQGKKAEQLLKDSLGFVDKLCGAICRIKVIETEAK